MPKSNAVVHSVNKLMNDAVMHSWHMHNVYFLQPISCEWGGGQKPKHGTPFISGCPQLIRGINTLFPLSAELLDVWQHSWNIAVMKGKLFIFNNLTHFTTSVGVF